jgi:hypothetical protein
MLRVRGKSVFAARNINFTNWCTANNWMMR